MPRLKTSINFNKEIFGNSFRSVLCLRTELVRCYLRCTEHLAICFFSVLWLRTELVRCFGLGPNYIGATPAAPNIWQFVFSVLYALS
jgi:hypothetical protein